MHIILFLLYVAGKFSVESWLKAFAEDNIGYHGMTDYHLWSCISTGIECATCKFVLLETFGRSVL